MNTELIWSCGSQWEIPTLRKVVMGCYLPVNVRVFVNYQTIFAAGSISHDVNIA